MKEPSSWNNLFKVSREFWNLHRFVFELATYFCCQVLDLSNLGFREYFEKGGMDKKTGYWHILLCLAMSFFNYCNFIKSACNFANGNHDEVDKDTDYDSHCVNLYFCYCSPCWCHRLMIIILHHLLFTHPITEWQICLCCFE